MTASRAKDGPSLLLLSQWYWFSGFAALRPPAALARLWIGTPDPLKGVSLHDRKRRRVLRRSQARARITHRYPLRARTLPPIPSRR